MVASVELLGKLSPVAPFHDSSQLPRPSAFLSCTVSPYELSSFLLSEDSLKLSPDVVPIHVPHAAAVGDTKRPLAFRHCDVDRELELGIVAVRPGEKDDGIIFRSDALLYCDHGAADWIWGPARVIANVRYVLREEPRCV